ncbi:MAG TPA: glycosyltransferase, partial [Pirellula sp.]|nr:glycosyltransferase [Pirellula sp.]
SIISQANERVEIVVCDNASEDDTRDVVEKFRRSFPALVYFRQRENVGADRNYLKSVELASGDYCWLFGSDDVLKEHAIVRVLRELDSGLDVYLCGLTLCSRDMTPICDHRVSRIDTDAVYDLGSAMERIKYFELALSTTALFSFLGSLIIKRSKWDEVSIDEERFIGTLWSHAAKVFGMIPQGLKLKYLREPQLFKRGENDSFLDKGMAHRINISVRGYQMMGDLFFGPGSDESRHIRRVLKLEWPLVAFIGLQRQCKGNMKEAGDLQRVFQACYSGPELLDRFRNLVFHSGLLSCLYVLMHSTDHLARSQVKKWIYGNH